MRQLTKQFRTQAMTLYVQSITREHEVLTNEINQIISGFSQENIHGIDAETNFAAFKHYNELREKRLNLEAQQSVYFLDEQRVEGDSNQQQQEEIIVPTLT
jgi:secreted Zn-dependent insulinase-like peptidase